MTGDFFIQEVTLIFDSTGASFLLGEKRECSLANNIRNHV